MSVTYYYWKTPEDAAFFFILLGLLGAIQIVLSYAAAFTLFIASPIVLTLVPLGVVLVQTTAAAVLANNLAQLLTSQRRQPHATPSRPIRQYLRRFGFLLIATGIILAIWGLIYTVFFVTTPLTFPFFVKYILGNTSGAILALIFAIIIDWLFTR